jgi:hypothetical protein
MKLTIGRAQTSGAWRLPLNYSFVMHGYSVAVEFCSEEFQELGRQGSASRDGSRAVDAFFLDRRVL